MKKKLVLIITVAISLLAFGSVFLFKFHKGNNEGKTMNAQIRDDSGKVTAYSYAEASEETYLYESLGKTTGVNIPKGTELYVPEEQYVKDDQGNEYLYVSMMNGNYASGYIPRNSIVIKTFNNIFYGYALNDMALYSAPSKNTKIADIPEESKIKIEEYSKESIIKSEDGTEWLLASYDGKDGYILYKDINIMTPYSYFSSVVHTYIGYMLQTNAMSIKQHAYVKGATNLLSNINNPSQVIIQVDGRCSTTTTGNYKANSGEIYKLAECYGLTGYVLMDDLDLYISYDKYVNPEEKKEEEVVQPEAVQAIKINSSVSDLVLSVDDEVGLDYTIKTNYRDITDNKDGFITFTSSNKKVATIDSDGKIKALYPGETEITLMSSDKKITDSVTVNVEARQDIIKIHEENITVLVGEKRSVSFTTPFDWEIAKKIKVEQQASNDGIVSYTKSWKAHPGAIIPKNDNHITVSGLKAGTTKITTTMTYNGETYKGEFNVTVKKQPSYLTLENGVKDITLDIGDSYPIYVTSNENSIIRKVTATCSTKNKVSGCAIHKGIVNFVYEETANGLRMPIRMRNSALIGNDSNRNIVYIKGMREGKTTITLTSQNNKTTKINVTVTKNKAPSTAEKALPSVVILKKGQNAYIGTNSYNPSTFECSWYAQDGSILSVENNPNDTAKIKALKEGKTRILSKCGKKKSSLYQTTVTVVK